MVNKINVVATLLSSMCVRGEVNGGGTPHAPTRPRQVVHCDCNLNAKTHITLSATGSKKAPKVVAISN